MATIEAIRIPVDPVLHAHEVRVSPADLLVPPCPGVRRSCGTVTASWRLSEAPRRESINLLGTVVARAFGLLEVGEVCTGDVILAGCNPRDPHEIRSLNSFLSQLLLGR